MHEDQSVRTSLLAGVVRTSVATQDEDIHAGGRTDGIYGSRSEDLVHAGGRGRPAPPHLTAKPKIRTSHHNGSQNEKSTYDPDHDATEPAPLQSSDRVNSVGFVVQRLPPLTDRREILARTHVGPKTP